MVIVIELLGMGEVGPDLREIFNVANQPAQPGVANPRVVGELGQPGQSRSLTEAEAQSPDPAFSGRGFFLAGLDRKN